MRLFLGRFFFWSFGELGWVGLFVGFGEFVFFGGFVYGREIREGDVFRYLVRGNIKG